MMRLRHSPLSPFVRKVAVFAYEAGLTGAIDIEPADVWAPGNDIFKDNPLGKIPALRTPDGVFVGSFAICDYLDFQHKGAPLIPRGGKDRWRVTQIHGLADGGMEAALAIVIETLRRPPEFLWEGQIERQLEKLRHAIDALAGRVDEFGAPDAPYVDLGAITVGCFLGYLDYRVKDRLDWRAASARLQAWNEAFARRESMTRTAPKGLAAIGGG